MSEGSFTSYAPNFEDVVLRRALAKVDRGCYIDGEGGRISLAFYELGWRGALVETDPTRVAELRRRRPGDAVVDRAAQLDEALAVRTVHFCTVANVDFERWQPWIVAVPAASPSVDQPYEAGYVPCVFDGVNRFYVHPERAGELTDLLSYPACARDAAFRRAVAGARRADDAEELASRAALLERENETLATLAREAAGEVEAMRATISWRVTRPLRAVRRAQRGNVRRPAPSSRLLIPATAKASVADKRVEHAFARRLAQAAEILQPGTTVDGDEMLPVFEDALASSSTSDRAKAWLSLVAADGTYPEERGVERMARILRMDGPQGVGRELCARFARSAGAGRAPMTELDVLRERIVVDVTHTASASDLHTGIQRVVRETVSRWLAAGYAFDLIRFDREPTAARRLTNDERERFKGWRRYVGSEVAASRSEGTKILVPWECDLVVPELPFETHRTSAYRGLVAGSILRSLSMVGYDVIPIVAAEKVVPQVTTDFAGYLSVVKHADRLSAISRTSKDSFAAFATMAAAEGPRMLRVEAHELPTEAPELDAESLSSARARLDIGPGPVVLVVGSHEPRKNHLTVLEAAERLWQRGDSFELVFLGWSGWLSEEFDELVDKLVLNGRSIVVRKRCSEDDLWAAYRLARFTVFPSLLEGYGLPIAESLASGTPVITSNYGSMAEVAALGGSLQVDPRDPDALERAMGRLLEDGAELERLREEARSSDTGTWESYAERLWVFLIGAP